MNVGLLFTSKGPGGLIALAALSVSLIFYGLLVRWIARGGQKEQKPWEEMGWPFK